MAEAVLSRDAEAIERSLATKAKEVVVPISREAAEFIAPLLKAKASGREVIVAHGLNEVTPSEAAAILGVSRPQVYRLMDKGLVPFRRVGTHARIPLEALKVWQASEKERREAALDKLAALSNETGLV
ncbi:MAG: helix-turn-helix domain-containing protein [Coriobacteriales bacterium]|jgi:excisionase family DNA binding protein|nr:helix-turn-helix domain-containing protein [Coriobacteriales bacterium]